MRWSYLHELFEGAVALGVHLTRACLVQVVDTVLKTLDRLQNVLLDLRLKRGDERTQ